MQLNKKNKPCQMPQTRMVRFGCHLHVPNGLVYSRQRALRSKMASNANDEFAEILILNRHHIALDINKL